jgi:hypothetical protein
MAVDVSYSYRRTRGLSELQLTRLSELEKRQTVTPIEAGEAAYLAHVGNQEQQERAAKIIGKVAR